MIDAAGGSGGFLVALPQYRPTLVRAMAEALGLAYIDFRAERLTGLGPEAPRLPVAALTSAITDALTQHGRGVVLHNAEALLASKPDGERRAWLASVMSTDWKSPVVVPIALYQSDMPCVIERICHLDPGRLPEESLLMRLASR